MPIQDPETYAVIGAAMRVHTELGRGFLEIVYQDALELELRAQKIPYDREKQIFVRYRGMILPSHFSVDFVCYENIIVELKALSEYSGKEKAQVLNYLKASGYQRGLLINFGKDRLEHERVINFFDEREQQMKQFEENGFNST